MGHVTHLLDINVLLALGWSNHAHAVAAQRWFANAAVDSWSICLLSQSGFLRLSINRTVVGRDVSIGDAMSVLRSLIDHPGHMFLPAGRALTENTFDQIASSVTG